MKSSVLSHQDADVCNKWRQKIKGQQADPVSWTMATKTACVTDQPTIPPAPQLTLQAQTDRHTI